MITSREVVTAVMGVLRFVRMDPAAMRYFDATETGFWRSFYAALLIAPFYAVILMLRWSEGDFPSGLFRYWAAESIGYVVGWVLFPLVMVGVARALGREGRYFGFICAYNWFSLVQMAIYFPIGLLAQAGGAELLPAVAFLGLMAMGAIVVWTWFIAKTALDVPSPTAAMIAAGDLLLGVFVNLVVTSMVMQPG